MQKTLKWSAAQPIKRPDNIISSKARETGDYGFKPSYLSEPSENMKFIMSNEYMRIWFKEKGKYEKDTYSREEIIKEESKIKRRFVQRMMTYRRPDKNYFLDEKVEKLHKKSQNDDPIDYSKYKYKPRCSKMKKKMQYPVKAGAQTANNEDDECGDSKNEENPTVIVRNHDARCCIGKPCIPPCPCYKKN